MCRERARRRWVRTSGLAGGRRQGRGSEAALLLSGGFGEAAWPRLPREESSPAACCWGTLALGAVSRGFPGGCGCETRSCAARGERERLQPLLWSRG